MPLCKRKGSVCPVEDCATDPRIEWAVEQFIKAKEFSMLPYAGDLQKKLLREAGILEDVDLLYELESIYSQYQLLEAQKNIK